MRTKYKNLCAEAALIRTKSQVATALKAEVNELKEKNAKVGKICHARRTSHQCGEQFRYSGQASCRWGAS